MGNKILSGSPLKNLTEEIQLCQLLFAHPKKYSPPQKQLDNDYDILVDFPVNESRPFFGSLYVQPWNPKEVFTTQCENNMQVCFNVRLAFPKLEGGLDLRLIIGYGNIGMWPEMPVIVVPHKA